MEARARPRACRAADRLFRHRVANHANHGQQDTAANAAAGDLTKDRRDIQTAACCGFGHAARAQHGQDLPADAAADNARDRIDQRALIEVLQHTARNVATNSARQKTNDKFHSYPLKFVPDAGWWGLSRPHGRGALRETGAELPRLETRKARTTMTHGHEMETTMHTVLILGSGPNAPEAADMPKDAFDAIVAINNAWRIRPDWTHAIYPEDFPPDRHPPRDWGGVHIIAKDFVPAQNRLGGFVYAGGTMAYTAAYWALDALRPRVMAFLGCDMVYPSSGATHFYGTGTADPLRDDITLQDLSAKSARLEIIAARHGCACVNLSSDESRLVFPRARPEALRDLSPRPFPDALDADRLEAELGYFCASGRYWEDDGFDAGELRKLDALWRAAHDAAVSPA